MDISLKNIGKKFQRNWVFRNLDAEIPFGEEVAIIGHNGSGKSTLLQIIGGFIAPSEGQVVHSEKSDRAQTHCSIVAPYQQLIEEFTLIEHLQFHSKFKQPLLDLQETIERAGLGGFDDKLVKEFSSGMKQRLRLILGFYFESKVLLLDEPTANLDDQGISWYLDLLKKRSVTSTVVIASNQKMEYEHVSKVLNIENFKKT